MQGDEPQGANVLADFIRRLVADEVAACFGISGPPCDGADLLKVERLAAACDSISYMNDRAPACARFADAHALLAAAMASRRFDGLVLEFGVYSGRTLNHIASLTQGVVHGFDSFEGLPEDWRPDIREGAFRTGALPEVRSNVELVVGRFDATLPSFVAAHPGPVALLHVDCDLYSSTRTLFHFLAKQIVSGTIIVFDEYLNYVG